MPVSHQNRSDHYNNSHCRAAVIINFLVFHHGSTAVQAGVLFTPVVIGNGLFWTTVNKKRPNRLSPKFAQVITLVPSTYVRSLVAIRSRGTTRHVREVIHFRPFSTHHLSHPFFCAFWPLPSPASPTGLHVVRTAYGFYGRGYSLHLSSIETTVSIDTKFETDDKVGRTKRIAKFDSSRIHGSGSPY
jgi:hypothetical protein